MGTALDRVRAAQAVNDAAAMAAKQRLGVAPCRLRCYGGSPGCFLWGCCYPSNRRVWGGSPLSVYT